MQIIGYISSTIKIRYGDYLEEVINQFLKENGALLLNETTIDAQLNHCVDHLLRKKSKCDLLFKWNETIYVGEIKTRDNHDSTKKSGQINNLIKKYRNLSRHYGGQIVAVLFFIDEKMHKNKSFYQQTLTKQLGLNNAFIYYGDQFFKKLKLLKQWNDLKNLLKAFNDEIKNKRLINLIISQNLSDDKNFSDFLLKLQNWF